MSQPSPEIPAPAAALYHLLSALFNYIDEEIEPRFTGVVTMSKFEKLARQIDMIADFSESLSATKDVQMGLYNDLECQYYLVPETPVGGLHDYSFRDPDSVGLTKAGYIKLQAISLIVEMMPGMEGPAKDLEYRFLQNCIQKLPLSRIDPATGTKVTFAPLPPQTVVAWYVATFANSVLGIEANTVVERFVGRQQVRLKRQAAVTQQHQPQPPQASRPPTGPADPADFQAQLDQLRAREQEQALSHMRQRMAEAGIRRSAESSFMMGLI